MTNIISAYALISDPAFLTNPEENDSATVATSTSDIILKEMESFYIRAEKVNSSQRKFKVSSGGNNFFDFFDAGEIIASNKVYKTEKNRKVNMWGEADLSFELKEMIGNYRELLKSYQSQLNWADKVNNDQISDLMNVKIKQTKKLIKECKRNLRKY
jgi:hypothetical protein